MPSVQLRWQPIAVLLALALVWGANMAIIKIGSRELAPLFMAGLRSLVAALIMVCLGMVLVNYRPPEEAAAPADS
jgi:drug/metabolite transporter (DMT)-like permease